MKKFKDNYTVFLFFDIIINMIEKNKYLSTTLLEHPQGKEISTILASAIEAVEPGAAIRNTVKRKKDYLIYGETDAIYRH